MIIKPQYVDLPHLPNTISLVPKPLHLEMTSRAKVMNGTTKARTLSNPKSNPQSSATNAKVMDT